MNHNILLVEDEQSIAEAILFICKRYQIEVDWCSTAQSALNKINLQQDPRHQLIVLDVGLPDMNGFELCKEIRKTSSIPIIFLTAHDSEVDTVTGLELGADDYITKPFSPRELVARINAILRRSAHSAAAAPQAEVAQALSPVSASSSQSLHLDKDRACLIFNGVPVPLSRYEYNICAVMLLRPGKIYSRQELMDRAWEEPDMSLERTVDAHIKSIRAKLRAISPEEVIITHRGFGYSFKD